MPTSLFMSYYKAIEFKLFCAILTKIELFWSSTHFFMLFQISTTWTFFATLRTVIVAFFPTPAGSNCLFLCSFLCHLQVLEYVGHIANNFQLYGPSYVGLLRQKGREIWLLRLNFSVHRLSLWISISFSWKRNIKDLIFQKNAITKVDCSGERLGILKTFSSYTYNIHW
jgi:hypothetical protein